MATENNYGLVSSKNSKYVGYEPTGARLVVNKEAQKEEVERSIRILRRMAKRNGHPNLSLTQTADGFFVMSNQFGA